jgi:GrpB-like predicted nucleotidyltransferase (UPF0157 family)
MMAIDVVQYDPAWPAQFQAEAAALAEVLRPWLVAPVEHIGSTSVPGLDAKPILDMMAGVHDLTSASDAIPPLSALGYIHFQHRPATLAFYKLWPGDPGQDSHHLHLTEPGSSLWRERLAFRDALRADPERARQYQQLKERLAAESPDLAIYTAGKRAFIVQVIGEAGITAEDWRSAAGSTG